MPQLRNERHEKFAQELAKGHQIFDAYRRAGYNGTPSNASHLRKDISIKARVDELTRLMDMSWPEVIVLLLRRACPQGHTEIDDD